MPLWTAMFMHHPPIGFYIPQAKFVYLVFVIFLCYV
jgi:hypothetical protein